MQDDVDSIDPLAPSLFADLDIDYSVLLSKSYHDYSNYMTGLTVRA